MLTGEVPYSNLQPGIINFKLNTINRASGNSESPSSVLVTTGLSTTLTAGQTYTVSVTHNDDAQIFPGARNNIRIWIDYNNNFSFLDAGETVVSVDLELPNTTYTGTFTVPAGTPAGTLALRATAKMSADVGHSIPTPCNVPPDPLGYHGEMEDYTIIMEAGAGQSPTSSFALSSTVCLTSKATATNSSTGLPAPTYSWSSAPAAGVTFSPSATASNPAISFPSVGNYTITCMATNSVSSNSSNKVISVSACGVGLNETNLTEQLTFHPNPVADILTVRFTSEMKDPVFRVANYLGQVVIEKQIPGVPADTSIDLSSLENGVYFVSVRSGQTSITKQVIVNR